MSALNKMGIIFKEYGEAYCSRHSVAKFQAKAMRNIQRCRTSELGGHVDRCDHCGYERIFYNSCRNRHCPNCQHLAQSQWLSDRENELLPISYYHVVFTIPDELNRIALVNQQVIYDILFQAASETLLTLCQDHRHMGGEIGIIAVLHTWGQNLLDHPHLHCIVTGGGLSKDRQQWIYPKKRTLKNDFFIHVNIISDLFKKKFLVYLKQRYQSGAFNWVGRISNLKTATAFNRLLTKLYAKQWVTYCKKPFGGPQQALRYLGRYTHRVAISNQRIVTIADGQVTFKWRDYRDNTIKLMTLDVFEFIRRFLLHILPDRYYKIRYYGILANRYRSVKLGFCRQIFALLKGTVASTARASWEALLLELTGLDVKICPRCQVGRMVLHKRLPFSNYVPT